MVPLPQHVPPVPAQGRRQPWSWRRWKLHFDCCWAARRGELLISGVLNHQSQAVGTGLSRISHHLGVQGKVSLRGPGTPSDPSAGPCLPQPSLPAGSRLSPCSPPCPPTQPSVLLLVLPAMMEREVYSPAIKHCLILTLQHRFIDPWIQTKAHKLPWLSSLCC